MEKVLSQGGQVLAEYQYDFPGRLSAVDLLSKVRMGYSYDIQGKTRSIVASVEGAPKPKLKRTSRIQPL